MGLIDTHCHIHSADFNLPIKDVLKNASKSGVVTMICVGTSADDTEQAVAFAVSHDGCFASVGLHPHDAKLGEDDFEVLARLVHEPKVVAVGECGLDYYYNHSSKEDQEKALRYQIELALSVNKPIIFHVRDAFDDFWPIFDSYNSLRGVIHSFTASTQELDQALTRGLYIGLNGIMTFTKDQKQLDAAKAVPLEKLLLETDAPFLTPVPKRGTINEPANVELVAVFLSRLREESVETLSEVTTGNAHTLFGI